MKPHTFALVSIAAVLVAMAASAGAPKPPPATRVVFDVSAGEPERWAGVVTNVENVRATLGAQTQVEVVAYGKGIGLVLASDTQLAPRMSALASAGVSFVACENTLRKQGIDRKQLLPFVKTVDSGVAELIRRQQAGWAYLKPGG